jgi:hypothetical protein
VRFSHQESVPVEGCDRRRWPGLQRQGDCKVMK